MKFKKLWLPLVAAFLVGASTTSVSASSWPAANADAVEIYDMTANKVIYTKNATRTYDLASISKLMTAYLALQKIHNGHSWNEKVTITNRGMINMSNDYTWGQLHFKKGEKITIKQLYQLSLLPSSNEAATLLGRWATGSDANFVKRANALSKSLGMKSAYWVNASGADNVVGQVYGFYVKGTHGNNRLNAADMVKLSSALVKKYPEITNTTRMNYTSIKWHGARFHSTVGNVTGNTWWVGGNRYDLYDKTLPIVGLKNGFTDSAGHTQVNVVQRPGKHKLLIVALHAHNWRLDNLTINDLLKYAYADIDGLHYTTKNVNYSATVKVKRTDKIYTKQPGGVVGNKVVRTATAWQSQTLTIVKEARTKTATWAGFYYNGQLSWIKKAALTQQKAIKNVKQTLTFKQNGPVYVDGLTNKANGKRSTVKWLNKSVVVTKQATDSTGVVYDGFVKNDRTYWVAASLMTPSVVSLKTTSYVATIDQSRTVDGVYQNQPAVVAGTKKLGMANTSAWKNKQVLVAREMVTATGSTWAGFWQNGKLVWLAKRALVNAQSIQHIKLKVKFDQSKRNDGVYLDGSAGFANSKRYGSVKSLKWDKKTITVTKQFIAKNKILQYGYVLNGHTYWFDSRAVK